MSNVILASQSTARQNMLSAAGVDFTAMPAHLDEASFQSEEKNAACLSLLLSQEKAKFISCDNSDKYIIGSDQVLVMNGKIFNKAKNKSNAIKRLKEFSGQAHYLHSSVVVVKNSEILFEYTDSVKLMMKDLSNNQIDDYAAQAGDVLTSCVGCYAIEGLGVRLFDSIEGDYFTIMGMPLLPLLNYLESVEAI